ILGRKRNDEPLFMEEPSRLSARASGTLLTLGTHAPPRHARERGYPGRPTPCLGPWTPAFVGVTEDEATGVICLVRTARRTCAAGGPISGAPTGRRRAPCSPHQDGGAPAAMACGRSSP